MSRLVALVAALLCVSSVARADVFMPHWTGEASEQTCADSFPERLADFRAAVPAHQQYMAEYNRAMPWFHEHCRWLTDLEIAIRKIDDAAAFVCDTQKGRPAGLTSEFALDHNAPAGLSIFIDHSASNRVCAEFDAKDRVMLFATSFDSQAVQARVIIEGMCWQVSSAKCDQGRAAIAAADAAAKP